MNLKELKIKEQERNILAELVNPKTIAEVAAILENSYTTAFTKLVVWEAKGWVIKLKIGRGTKYYLNQDIIQI